MDYRDERSKHFKKMYEESTTEQLTDHAKSVWCDDPRVDCLLTELAKRLEKALNEMAS